MERAMVFATEAEARAVLGLSKPYGEIRQSVFAANGGGYIAVRASKGVLAQVQGIGPAYAVYQAWGGWSRETWQMVPDSIRSALRI